MEPQHVTRARANFHGFQKGMRVTVSGAGRTATWGSILGTVTQWTSHHVYVRWDGTHFEDEMEPGEIKHARKA